MIQWRHGRVRSVGRSWAGAQEYTVDLLDDDLPDAVHPDDTLPGRTDGAAPAPVRALAYPALVGELAPGERVLLNTTALEAGLGTGGHALVVAPADRLPQTAGAPAVGHLVKARYTPLQAMVLGVDEPDSPHHAVLRDADDLAGMPVVVADLHSALPAVVAGVRARRPDARVAYVMTDGAALPAWLSRSVAGLREAGWLDCCLSAGQAFGGDLEAATVQTALLAAHLVVGADVTVVAPGPGVLGTGTRWGFSGVEVGEAVNAVAGLGGRPVAALRVSAADPRPRHRGLSHHSRTALGRVALAPCDVVVPVLDGDQATLTDLLRQEAAPVCAPAGRHRLVEIATTGLREAVASSPVPPSTMGRGLDEDAPAFLAAAAAGAHAADLVATSGQPQGSS